MGIQRTSQFQIYTLARHDLNEGDEPLNKSELALLNASFGSAKVDFAEKVRKAMNEAARAYRDNPNINHVILAMTHRRDEDRMSACIAGYYGLDDTAQITGLTHEPEDGLEDLRIAHERLIQELHTIIISRVELTLEGEDPLYPYLIEERRKGGFGYTAKDKNPNTLFQLVHPGVGTVIH